MVTDAEWARIRRGLRFGQVFEGAVAKVPRPGAIGIFVDIGLSVGGFVDVLLLPEESDHWPTEGTVADFEIWWADSRQQIRLKPSDFRYLRNDFTDFVGCFRPNWSSEVGQPVGDPRPSDAAIRLPCSTSSSAARKAMASRQAATEDAAGVGSPGGHRVGRSFGFL